MKHSQINVLASIFVCFLFLSLSPTTVHAQKEPTLDAKPKPNSNTTSPKPPTDEPKYATPADAKSKPGTNVAESPKPPADGPKHPTPDAKMKPGANSTSPKPSIDDPKHPTPETKTKPGTNTTSPKPPAEAGPKHPSVPDEKTKPISPKPPAEGPKHPSVPDEKTKPGSNATSPKLPPAKDPKHPTPDTKTKPGSDTTPEKPPTGAPKPTGPDSTPKPKPNTNSTSPKPNPSPNNKSPKTNPKPSPTPSKPKPSETSSPYHFANHFCLSRRLDVRGTFCLQVLRSSPQSTKAKDNMALLHIAVESAVKFGTKTNAFLKKLAKDKKTKPDMKEAIEECLSAYDGYLAQYKVLLEEAKSEAQLASYDAELAKIEIKRCAKALGKTKNDDIAAQNKVAMDYTKLSQNIADSID